MEVIGQIFLEGLCYFTAKLLLPLASMGRLRTKVLDPSEEKQCKWGVFRSPTGTYLHHSYASIVGLALWSVIFMVGIYLHFW